MSGFIKAAERVPAGQAVFFRSACALPVIFIWLWLRGDLTHGLRTQNYRGHIYRSVAGTIAMGLGFAGLKFLPLPDVTALRFITPILIVIFAAVLLGERIRLVRLSAVLMGLVGVLIILWPRLGDGLAGAGKREMIGAAMVLGSAAFAAFSQIFIKRMASVERTAAIVFYFSLTSLTLSLLSVPFGWVWPTGMEWALLVGAGVVGGLGQILLTSSYKYADASVLAPFTYVSMIWALLIGYFVFEEVPTVMMLAGAALVILSGVVIVLRERQLGKGRAAMRNVAQPK
ncbi:MAG: DMT family transporter [Marinosulfonomonas sp.]|nr:DMT family transporter [Marinosulfonomonas sp.]